MSMCRGRTLALAALLAATTLPASGQDHDLEAARRLALNHCGACHAFAAGEAHRQGPNLHGVLSRPAGGAEDFAYSDAFRKALAGKSWTAELLDSWLEDPQAVAPGTVMLYRQADPDKRAMLVRFLQSLEP
jgi:cytochrome c